MSRTRAALTYSNVMATIAVFIALGGSSYAAVKLSRNSVGATQIRSKAVGSSELRTGAVSSRSIHDRTIQTQDLSLDARGFLKGQTGPAGPHGPIGPTGLTYRATVDSGGGVVIGNGQGAGSASGSAVITFGRALDGCVATATLTRVMNGPKFEDGGPGRLTATVEGNNVRVFMYDRDGNPANLPFNLIVAC